MRCCYRSSHKTATVLIVASIVATLTTLAVLAMKMNWWDKLCACHKNRRYSRPSFTCKFEESAPITEVVKKEVFPEESTEE